MCEQSADSSLKVSSMSKSGLTMHKTSIRKPPTEGKGKKNKKDKMRNSIVKSIHEFEENENNANFT